MAGPKKEKRKFPLTGEAVTSIVKQRGHTLRV